MAKNKTLEFKQVDVVSLAKMSSLFGIILGLIAGIGLAFISQYSSPNMPIIMPFNYGILAIVIFPIVYGIIYFIGGLVTGYAYNILAKKIGGVKIQV
jgi:hypothetical protein